MSKFYAVLSELQKIHPDFIINDFASEIGSYALNLRQEQNNRRHGFVKGGIVRKAKRVLESHGFYRWHEWQGGQLIIDATIPD
jgi:hypothetical protein